MEPIYYSIHTGYVVDPTGYPPQFVTTNKPPAPGYKFTGTHWVASDPIVQRKLAQEKVRIFEDVNEAVMEAYRMYTPLNMEYLEREKQAQDWDALEYAGPVPPQILAFSNPARVNPVEACKLILLQAKQFRAALDYMSIIRMRKHEVDTATTIKEARDIEKNLMAQVKQVIQALP